MLYFLKYYFDYVVKIKHKRDFYKYILYPRLNNQKQRIYILFMFPLFNFKQIC